MARILRGSDSMNQRGHEHESAEQRTAGYRHGRQATNDADNGVRTGFTKWEQNQFWAFGSFYL